MGYVESLLGEDERVLYVTRHHWTILLGRLAGQLILFVAAVALAVAANLYGGQLFDGLGLSPSLTLVARAGVTVLLVIYPVVVMIAAYARWRGDRFIVTNFRVIHVTGILSKSVIDSSLDKVNDVMLQQSLFGRIFDFGSLEILTSSDIGVNKLARVGHPVQFKKAMLNAKQDLEEPARVGAPSLPQLLSDLAALRDRGILTEQEYQVQKAELLDHK